MPVSKKDTQDIDTIVRLAFSEPLREHKTVRGVDVYLQSLGDAEMRDAIRRGMMAATAPEQLFEIPRWKIAYSLIAVGGKEFPKQVEEKRKVIDTWLGFIVEAVIEKYEELETEELRLVDRLKNSFGTQEQFLNT